MHAVLQGTYISRRLACWQRKHSHLLEAERRRALEHGEEALAHRSVLDFGVLSVRQERTLLCGVVQRRDQDLGIWIRFVKNGKVVAEHKEETERNSMAGVVWEEKEEGRTPRVKTGVRIRD